MRQIKIKSFIHLVECVSADSFSLRDLRVSEVKRHPETLWYMISAMTVNVSQNIVDRREITSHFAGSRKSTFWRNRLLNDSVLLPRETDGINLREADNFKDARTHLVAWEFSRSHYLWVSLNSRRLALLNKTVYEGPLTLKPITEILKIFILFL